MLWHRGGEAGRWEQGGRGRGFCTEPEGELVLGEGSPPKLGACLEECQSQQRECHHEPLRATRGTSSLWQTPILVSNDRRSRGWCQLYA
jgi:hypothetical protein